MLIKSINIDGRNCRSNLLVHPPRRRITYRNNSEQETLSVQRKPNINKLSVTLLCSVTEINSRITELDPLYHGPHKRSSPKEITAKSKLFNL